MHRSLGIFMPILESAYDNHYIYTYKYYSGFLERGVRGFFGIDGATSEARGVFVETFRGDFFGVISGVCDDALFGLFFSAFFARAFFARARHFSSSSISDSTYSISASRRLIRVSSLL